MHAPAGAVLDVTRFALLGFTIRKLSSMGTPKIAAALPRCQVDSVSRIGFAGREKNSAHRAQRVTGKRCGETPQNGWAMQFHCLLFLCVPGGSVSSVFSLFWSTRRAGLTLAVQLVKQAGVFFSEGCASQQLRAVAQRLRKRHFAAPATNLLVVAAHEHLRHLPTAKLRGPGVVRIVQDTVTGELWLVTGMWPPLTPGLRNLVGRCQRMTGHRGLSSLHLAERLVHRRSFVTKRPGQQASHCIHNHRRGQLAAREHKIADGDLLGGQVLGHALVHALVSATEQHNMLEPREASRRLLPKKFA